MLGSECVGPPHFLTGCSTSPRLLRTSLRMEGREKTTCSSKEGDNVPPQPDRPTNFSIEEILKPDFGRRRGLLKCRGSEKGSEEDRANVGSSRSLEEEEGEERTVSGSAPVLPLQTLKSTPVVWPAWVYCTRYSDRPSSEGSTRKSVCTSTAGLTSESGEEEEPVRLTGDIPPRIPVEGRFGSDVMMVERWYSPKGSSPTTEKSRTPTFLSSSASSPGPRSRKLKKKDRNAEEKRPRTSFTSDQLQYLKKEFEECRYLTEDRRRKLARELSLSEAQIKIWFQNKRAKMKKNSVTKNPLALHLMAQGLYNHSTISIKGESYS